MQSFCSGDLVISQGLGDRHQRYGSENAQEDVMNWLFSSGLMWHPIHVDNESSTNHQSYGHIHAN